MMDVARFMFFACLYQGSGYAVAQAPQPMPQDSPALARAVANTLGATAEVFDRVLHADTDGGVIINQAITVAGQDFFQYFSSAWRDKEGSERFTLAIRERPSARWGSEVWIEYGQRRVYYAHLPPARAAIRSMSEAAAEIAYQAAMQSDLQRMLINDVDLARDEF